MSDVDPALPDKTASVVIASVASEAYLLSQDIKMDTIKMKENILFIICNV